MNRAREAQGDSRASHHSVVGLSQLANGYHPTRLTNRKREPMLQLNWIPFVEGEKPSRINQSTKRVHLSPKFHCLEDLLKRCTPGHVVRTPIILELRRASYLEARGSEEVANKTGSGSVFGLGRFFLLPRGLEE